MWGDWLSTGPLLIFIAAGSVVKSKSHRTDLVMIVSFFFCLLFGFLPIVPQPYWLAVLWILLAFICYVPVLYLPFHVRAQPTDYENLEENNPFAKRNNHSFQLALWLTFSLPLFPLNYLLSAFKVIGPEETISIFLILSVLTKALYVAIAMDVHSATLVEAEHSLAEERNANAARRAFLKYLFHEVRTPLNSLTMGLELLRQGSHMLPSDLELLTMMKGASVFMADTLNEVLSMQKIEEGKLELELLPFNIGASLSKVLNTCHGAILTKHIQVAWTIASDVPVSLIGDRYRVEHVLSNLLNNAIKFSPQNGKISIDINSSAVNAINSKSWVSITVSVRDNGPGISPENQRKLFRNYMQIRPGQLQEGQGSGLGLSLCKQIVTLHGGTIWVDSEEGRGSTFSFCIPFALVDDHSLVKEEEGTAQKTSSFQVEEAPSPSVEIDGKTLHAR